jgi:DnaJ-domain-containing protein 1
MAQNPSTSEHLCACGCGASVKPGQRWGEPACKARDYRRRQQAAPGWDYIKEIEDERRHFFRQMIELGNKLKALEEAYSELWEQHQYCGEAPLYLAPPSSGGKDAYAVLGVQADAEPEAIEGAYKALAKKYHPDRHPDDPVMDARMKAITTAYAEVLRLRARRQRRGAN